MTVMVESNGVNGGGFLARTMHSPPALASLLVAIMGQAVFSIYFQVVNNEQQQAQISSNSQGMRDLREQVFSMQTPLSTRVTKLEDRMDNNMIVFTMRAEEINRNISRIDEQQRRIIESLDNLYSEVSKIPPVLRQKSR